ncbi:BamA/TamA family outer membrane protein [Aureispira sp. CCB-E]|uniref:BamA/TamA family outer membrane protein n=1 Tax=Aureispira sp. CCB-E TaxID=3051121 RepID=UPI002868E21F|nr:BamA/TamA family outer membrane protein [Aureispira sp. CCB-E]WMX17190.1 BamA/TamA family outer membrane protein [Aureispira sp. CCB-E]
MKYKFEHFSCIFLLLCLLMSSCGNRKFLKSHSKSMEKPRVRVFDEYMVKKNQINFLKQKYKIQEDSENLYYEMSSIIQQVPDRSIIRGFRQMVYHLNDTLSIPYKFNRDSMQILPDTIRRKSTGLQRWLHRKVGYGPVILDTAKTNLTVRNMRAFLNQKGYYNAEVSSEITYKRHTAIVSYNIKTGMPILIDTVLLISKDTAIQDIMEEIKSLTVLKQGIRASVDNMNKERGRLELAIKNRGYFEFTKNYVVFRIDTVNAKEVAPKEGGLFNSNPEQGEPRANIYVEVLPYSDTSIIHPKYKICNVLITPNEYIVKASKVRKIKKDSFFIVERTLKDRVKRIVLKEGEIMLPKDSLVTTVKTVGGKQRRIVLRSLPRFKKVTLNARSEMQDNDKLVHILLRKIVRNKDGSPTTERQRRQTYFIRDKVISDAVPVEIGQLYSYRLEQETRRNINVLDVFRAPRVEYVISSNGEPNCLDCLVKMQRGEKQGVGGDFEINNNNTNVSSLGVAAFGSYQNKNIFKGAETFEISLSGGLDFKLTGRDSFDNNFWKQAVNLFDVSAETSLFFPRFLGFPFLKKMFKMESPTTKVSLGYRYLQQSTDFQISSFYTKIGYDWRRGPYHTFSWNPAVVNITLQPVLEPSFEALLRQNNRALYESLSASYLIPSMDFSYTFSSPTASTKGGSWYFKSSFELAGNLIYLLDQAVEPNKQLKFFGIDYSQYFKTDFDLRYSYKLGKYHSIASRFMFGIIIPYGNSEGTDVPFVKRFALGGPSSMRAWLLRYIGPGEQTSVNGAEFQLGDLRMEFNSEYRFMFTSWIGGAFFVDVGNIWLLNSRATATNIPQQNPKTGVFTERFYEQLAIGAGLGLRFDLSFFVFRVDFGIQLRDPQGYRLKEDGTVQYWNFDPFVLPGRSNLIFAVGYPF